LKEQLAPGGRLIMPINHEAHQVLTRIRRTGAESFEEEDHGLVAFVPLVGAAEWPPMVDNERRPESSPVGPPAVASEDPTATICPHGAVTELAIETGGRPTSSIGYEL